MPRALKILLPLVIIAAAGTAIWYFNRPAERPEGVLRIYGNVDLRLVRLPFQATGRVEKVMVEEGDVVKAGQVLAQLDAVRQEAAVARAQAEVAAQEQVVQRLMTGSRPQEIAEARARLDSAEATLSEASSLYRRNKALFERAAIAEQRLQDIRSRYHSAQAAVKQAREGLALVLEGPRQEDIAAARAQLRAAQAQLRLSESELTDTTLYATQAAVIQQRILEEGEMAFPSTPAFTLALTNPIWVRAYLPETALGRVPPGATARVISDSYPDKVYKGWVGFISPTAEFTPKTVETPELRTKLVYRLRVLVCNPENQLRLGMPVTVEIPLDQDPSPDRGQAGACGE